ncbi:M23 family metallopeptidase [Sphingorhabdus sp.]|uniref:M23 family metallopeptidase n=1 Tax=Sphingorhabdus sp. TaxID=1902408 RepID=UPI0035AE72F4
MFGKKETGFAAAGSGGNVVIADAMVQPLRTMAVPDWRQKLSQIDWVPDLGEDIGSLRWFRGLASLTILTVATLAFMPEFGPVYGAQPSMPTASQMEEARAQMITPLAFGSDTGMRMAASENVVALAASPERPQIELTATLGRGDSFARVLQRAGVGGEDADRALGLVAGATSLTDIEPGTPIAIVLGRRQSKNAARPLESLDFRARFDLRLALHRTDSGALTINRQQIAVDSTPLRIRGTAGPSLYRSARAAGAPAEVVQDFLKVIAGRTSLSSVGAEDEFDIVVDYKRAATGEVRVGELLFAGIDRGGKPRIQMLKWNTGNSSQWFEASGVGESRGALSRPVNGGISSGFGMRRHPILGYKRMHSGLDFKAGYGAPIFAATDGVVAYAGRKGGYGNYVQLNHGGGVATGYAHMSRIAAAPGQRVRQGQIIGYVGSTGLSTGPHLHYELYRNGRPINPLSITFTQRAQLSGGDLSRFKNELARLKAVKPGAALAPMPVSTHRNATPTREIDRISAAKVKSNGSAL